ncbi:MAG: response regulator [Leptospira sp.]|nr:response regulator [Leptospira sp.]
MSSKKVLLVDDSTVTRLMIKKIINDSKLNCECLEAESADKAHDLIMTLNHLDFATIDQNMPGTLSGLDFAEILLKKFPNIHIALVTANIQDAIRNKAKSIGIDFIEKPISAERLNPFLEKVQ